MRVFSPIHKWYKGNANILRRSGKWRIKILRKEKNIHFHTKK